MEKNKNSAPNIGYLSMPPIVGTSGSLVRWVPHEITNGDFENYSAKKSYSNKIEL